MRRVDLDSLPPQVRRGLLRVLHGTSAERAHVIGELFSRPEDRALAEFLADLEADEELRARVEIELMRSLHED